MKMIIIGAFVLGIVLLYIGVKNFTEPYHDKCFKEFKKSHPETKDKCGGAVGGDRHSNYLSYECIDCPYFNEEIWNRMEGK